PEKGVQIKVDDSSAMNVRLIDCVGYIVPSALGYIEGDQPRMVMTPWFEEPIPFNMAAEIGTRKVINEHSTIGLVITTDGSISDIPRDEYEEAESRVIGELRELNKPFIVLLNCMYPHAAPAKELSERLSEKYGVPVLPINCLELTETEIKEIMTQLLFEFPIREVSVNLPLWLSALPHDHWLRKSLYDAVASAANDMELVRDVSLMTEKLKECEYIEETSVKNMDLGCGSANISVRVGSGLFYKILSESTGLTVENEQSLMSTMRELASVKKEYDRLKCALDEVEATGYGIVMPSIDELTLEEPELVKQGGKYGVKLSASAPSIHMLKANIKTEVAPIVGSESQSEELVKYLLQGFEEDPQKIWESNIFGKSLHELVNEGLRGKLNHMPSDARMKLQETLERVINEGCNGLICIIL
ncbi:MAG TPA: stage IV sporulation protein A, partial [Ruminococcaceae bacterium]|nr:stage IV sporulation protein A [Oscillospiraceae bacterium]